MGSLQPKLLQLDPSRRRLSKNIVTTSTLSHSNRNLSRLLEGAALTSTVSVRARSHELRKNMRSTAAGRRYDATKAAASAVIGASSRLFTTANSPSKLSRSATPKAAVGALASSLTSPKDESAEAARRSFSRLSSRSSTTCRAYSSKSSEFIQRYPPSNALPTIQSTSLSSYCTTSSRTRQWWDALLAGIVAIASASWLVAASANENNSKCAACESSDHNATASAEGPAATSVLLASSATPAAAAESGGDAAAVVAPHANVVSFRPRWFDTILTSVSGGSSRGGSDDDSSSSLGNQDTRGVMLQSTGKPYDVRLFYRMNLPSVPCLFHSLTAIPTFA
jgi:hypothetical protein